MRIGEACSQTNLRPPDVEVRLNPPASSLAGACMPVLVSSLGGVGLFAVRLGSGEAPIVSYGATVVVILSAVSVTL
jgi:hypothetical protein